MVEVIVEIKDKKKVAELRQYGTITHVSKYINMVILEVHPADIPAIQKDDNVKEVREGVVGVYQI
jgi:uncharacterized protein YlbG (UPF0298 family)